MNFRQNQRDQNSAWRIGLLAAVAALFCGACQTTTSQRIAKRPASESISDAAPQAAVANAPAPAAPPQSESQVVQVGHNETQTHTHTPHHPQAPYPALPYQARTGASAGGCYGCYIEPTPGGAPRWTPPAIELPWPRDEYLCDGGDRDLPVQVGKDWTVYGLQQEDTVAHYDTLNGQTIVEPSNRVCIYAPRFAAVRRVDGVVLRDQVQGIAGLDRPLRVGEQDYIGGAVAVLQPVEPRKAIGAKGLEMFRDRNRGLGVDKTQNLIENQRALLPYEDLQVVRDGSYDNAEKARLAASQRAALAWTHPEGVMVVFDEQRAVERIGDTAAGETVRYELPDGKQRLRICKLASRDNAQPGEIVEFTLRFDNAGEQRIGNVTIVDNLTTRLEYIEGSAECSLEHEFFATVNEGESLILRWEIVEPMEVGDGGVIRFKCRVR